MRPEDWDIAQLRAAILSRLEQATVADDPFPYIIADDFWPADLYAEGEACWPSDAAFFVSKNRQKMNLAPAPSPPAAKRGDFAAMPDAQQGFWRFVVHTINRQIVGPWLVNAFRSHIDERLATLRQLQADGRLGFPVDLGQDVPVVTTGRLMMRGNGYVLRPHLDNALALVTALHYFGGGAEHEHGTVLFRAERPMPIDAFVRDGGTEYFHQAGIAVQEGVRVGFRPNRLVVFPNQLDAAHGVTAPDGEAYRKVFQFHIAVRDDTATYDA